MDFSEWIVYARRGCCQRHFQRKEGMQSAAAAAEEAQKNLLLNHSAAQMISGNISGTPNDAPAEDLMATSNAIGTTVLLCTMALALGAGCLSIQKARSKYRHYAMGCAQKEEASTYAQEEPVVISLYPAFPAGDKEAAAAEEDKEMIPSSDPFSGGSVT